MSQRQQQQAQELQTRLPQWLGPYLTRAARYVLEGPRWMPRWLRRVPLGAGCAVAKVYAARLL